MKIHRPGELLDVDPRLLAAAVVRLCATQTPGGLRAELTSVADSARLPWTIGGRSPHRSPGLHDSEQPLTRAGLSGPQQGGGGSRGVTCA
jgi:hypothetical protein